MSCGGQIRTIQCPCGWKVRSQLREANGRYKLHTKFCTFERMEIPAYDSSVNGVGGITHTRHKNTVLKPIQYNCIEKCELKE